MICVLPLTNDPVQQVVTTLGDITYQLYLRWNDRASFWTMDITDYNSQTPLITGMPLLLGCDLWDAFAMNNGSLIVWDESGSGVDASYDDLGSRINVYWFSADEVANALAS